MSRLAMQPSYDIVLRDIHQTAPPPWWPPAPGWWIVIAALVLTGAALAWWRVRRRRRRAAIERAFDAAVAAAATPAARVAGVSELLRRAARLGDPQADRLQGDAWLRFLDGVPRRRREKQAAVPATTPFSDGPGRLLLDGGFRRDVAEAEVATLLPLARDRYLQLMEQAR